MKKQKTSRSVRINVDNKRRKRNLRSKAKKNHRAGTGVKDLEEN